MIQHSLRRPLVVLFPVFGGMVAPAAVAVMAMTASPVQAAPLPYATAVTNTQVAARAVLGRKGRETCLRGKLTRALLGLSSSCEASGSRNPLCTLADQAVVVTPMSLSFMDDTSRQLLQLIQEEGSAAQATGAAQPSGGAPAAGPGS